MENQNYGRRHDGIILGYKTVPRLRRRSRNHSCLHHPASQLTMSSPSSSSSRSSERHSTRTTPSLYDLHNIILNCDLPTLLNQAFQLGHASTSNLQHFCSLTRTIRQLEQDLAHYQDERDTIFQELEGSTHYWQMIQPIYRYYWTHYAIRSRPQEHPYQRPSRSSSTSFCSSRSIPSQGTSDNTAVDPSLSPTAESILDSILNTYPSSTPEPSGTPENPIVINDSDNPSTTCTRCGQQEHIYEDCDTQIRLPGPCHAC